MLIALSGPTRPPVAGGKPRRLVILLHGLGADGNDLIGLQQVWGRLLPEAEFVSPNAPFPCDMAPYGYQWFSSQDRSPEAVLGGVRAAAVRSASQRPEWRAPAAPGLPPDRRPFGRRVRQGHSKDPQDPSRTDRRALLDRVARRSK